MLCRIGNFFKGEYIAWRASFKQYKYIYLAVLASIFIGILIALSKVKVLSDKYCDGNIIILIKNGNFRYVSFYLKLAFITLFIFFLANIFSFNRVVFLFIYPFICIVTYLVIRNVFVSCYLDGLTGYLSLFALYLPLIVIFAFVFSMYLLKVYSVTVEGTVWKYCMPIKCVFRSTKKLYGKYVLISVFIEVLFSGLFFLIVNLIVK